MTYKVELTKKSLKELKKISKVDQVRILRAVDKLSNNPRQKPNTRQMTGSTAWRLRVGNYRVIYDIHDREVRVLVIRVRHRRDVYRDR
jgi:mRNA interferase RelE/StbE